MTSSAELLRRALVVVGNTGVLLAQEFLRTNGASETLQEHLDFVVDEVRTTGPVAFARGRVTVPHYWALYVHDGRGAFEAPPGRLICFFPDKRDDPRTDGGTDYPASRSFVRHLSKEEFRHYVTLNRERVALGQAPIMVVTRVVGPVRDPHPSIPFFVQGLRKLPEVASRVIPPEFRLFVEGRGLLKRGRTQGVLRIG